jgi:hypothetical protein
VDHAEVILRRSFFAVVDFVTATASINWKVQQAPEGRLQQFHQKQIESAKFKSFPKRLASVFEREGREFESLRARFISQ